jgi:multimeric flavodoxin WrbA
MSKKVLVLSSSPRKGGNSDLLCDELIQGAEAAGHRTEKISLSNKKIGYCTACEVCHNNGGSCVQKDDMTDILEKMVASDVIVMATPVYFYTLSAQMKTLIDRTVARYLEITNKEFYFIATAADDDLQALARTIECFRGFTACLDGAVERGVIYGTGVWKKGEVKKTPAMQQAYEMGKTI